MKLTNVELEADDMLNIVRYTQVLVFNKYRPLDGFLVNCVFTCIWLL